LGRGLSPHGDCPQSRAQVVVTHDLEAARLLADHTFMLRVGKLVRADNVRKEDYEQAYT